MRKIIAAAVILESLFLSPTVLAEDAGVKLSKDELASFIPGTKAVLAFEGRPIHRWTNEPGGTFVATMDTTEFSLQRNVHSSAPGRWKISDDGKYCVAIDWARKTEKWCHFVFRTGDGGYYLSSSDAPDAKRFKIELSK